MQSMSRTSDMTAAKVSRSMARVGVAVASAFAAYGGVNELIRVNAEFGASMQRVAAVSGATAQEMDMLRESARELGRTTQFTASQAADALGFLAMAGFSAVEANQALPEVLNLAAASGMDLAAAADIASNVLSGFGKGANEAGKAADVLAAASSSAASEMSSE